MRLCPDCNGLGWLLNELHTGDRGTGSSLSLDLQPCFHPECNAPRIDGDPRPIDTLSIRGQFTDVVRSPRGMLMALTGFTQAVYR